MWWSLIPHSQTENDEPALAAYKVGAHMNDLRVGPQRHWTSVRRTCVRVLLFAGLLMTLAVESGNSSFAEDLTKSGTVRIQQTQVAFIGSANLGSGTLNFGGRSVRFKIGGLGVGGFGISKITATGNVYNLWDLAYFPGAYVQARYGAVIGDRSTGKLWLRNSNGVIIELRAEREGLALSLGGDAIYIDLK